MKKHSINSIEYTHMFQHEVYEIETDVPNILQQQKGESSSNTSKKKKTWAAS